MADMFRINWSALFIPSASLAELFLRGSLTYLGIFFLLRIVLKREAGQASISDLLVLVLLADAAQQGLAGRYDSITEGILLVATIIFWDYAINWASYRWSWLDRLVNPLPLLLVERGEIRWRNMRREFITANELRSILRERGIDDLVEVKQAYMEPDGHISVILHEDVGKDKANPDLPEGPA